MKYISIPLLLSILIACSNSTTESPDQDEKPSEKAGKVVVISGHSSSRECSRSAIKVTENDVEFDDCYDEDLGEFNSDRSMPLADIDLYNFILKTDIKQWRRIETENRANQDEDAGLPFIINITSNGSTESIFLLRTGKYTDNRNHFLYDVEDLFDNWDLIMSHIPEN